MATLSSRREFLFLYDIRMGNPNGDPDENRPRVLPDGTHYVTDVRLKRFIRDHLKTQGHEILVDTIEGKTTNLTGRVAHFLSQQGKTKIENPEETLQILLEAFIDARLFGSSFAFKKQDAPEVDFAAPRTLTGAVQINHGEVKHEAEEIDIHGTSVFASAEEKGRGTFTTYFGLRYALIAFNGVANEHSAQLSRLTDEDYVLFLRAMWNGVRSAGNTRTKYGQVPRLLLSVNYKPGNEFQFGNLADYVVLTASDGKAPKTWASPEDYTVDVSRLFERIGAQMPRVDSVSFCQCPDLRLSAPTPDNWQNLDFDNPEK